MRGTLTTVIFVLVLLMALVRLSAPTSTDLNPEVRSLGLVTLAQLDGALISELRLSQSLLLVWPQLVGLVAITVVVFAAAHLIFMRQEVRA